MEQEQRERIASFAERCRAAGADTVILAWREEWGPLPGGVIEYGHVRQRRLLAYADGALLSCELVGGSREAIAELLQEAGLRVEERCRNLS